MVRDTPSSQDASTHQIWNSYLKEYRRYAPDTKRDGHTEGRTVRLLYASQSSFGGIKGQGHSDPKMVGDTPSSQDASTHKISYLKEYRRYAPDTKRDGHTDGRTDSAITICLPKFLWGHKKINNEIPLFPCI